MTWASPDSLEMAAHSGAAPLFTNYRSREWSTTTCRRSTRSAPSHGWPVSPSAIATTVHVHQDGQRAREVGQQYWQRKAAMTLWHYDRLAAPYFMPDATPEERTTAVIKGYENQAAAGIFGSPDEVIEQIRELQQMANMGHLITLHSFGDMPARPGRGEHEAVRAIGAADHQDLRDR